MKSSITINAACEWLGCAAPVLVKSDAGGILTGKRQRQQL